MCYNSVMSDHRPATSSYISAPAAAIGAHEITLTQAQFERMRDLLADFSGVHLDDTRQRVLAAGLARRLQATGDDLESYERRVRAPHGRDELRKLAEQILNHETFFFRNRPHMRALQEVLLPEVRQRKSADAPIRIWSAGCATGEEAYSLAIALLETFGPQASRTCSVWATDMSQAAVARARAGYYHGRALGNLTPDMLARYFTPHGHGYVVNDTLRSMVQFDTHNLLDPFPAAAQGVDIIFCQNVLIYFQLDTCRTILDRFYTCLPGGGLLFLGFSETLWNVFDKFQSREVLGAYIYTKGAPPAVAPAARSRRSMHISAAAQRAAIRPASKTSEPPARATAREVDQDLFSQARALLQHGRHEQAMEVLRRISPRSPVAARALSLVARIHADRGDLDLAAAEAQRAIEIDQMTGDAHMLLGIIAFRQGEWAQAVQRFEKARYLQPAAPLISFYLAEAHARLGLHGVAAREYRATLWKLRDYDATQELDGVAVDWLRRACEQQLAQHAQP
jgi:chemotaxis protein methyltransferase CheR